MTGLLGAQQPGWTLQPTILFKMSTIWTCCSFSVLTKNVRWWLGCRQAGIFLGAGPFPGPASLAAFTEAALCGRLGRNSQGTCVLVGSQDLTQVLAFLFVLQLGFISWEKGTLGIKWSSHLVSTAALETRGIVLLTVE